jgi:hypothetical protein
MTDIVSAVPKDPWEDREDRARAEQRAREHAEATRLAMEKEELERRQYSTSPLYPTKGIREGDLHGPSGF